MASTASDVVLHDSYGWSEGVGVGEETQRAVCMLASVLIPDQGTLWVLFFYDFWFLRVFFCVGSRSDHRHHHHHNHTQECVEAADSFAIALQSTLQTTRNKLPPRARFG